MEPSACLAHYIDQINDIVANVCDKSPSTAPTGDTALGNCNTLVVQTVSQLMMDVCQSTVPNTCVNNLIAMVDGAIGDVCGDIPVPSGGAGDGVPPGVGTCAVKVVGAINLIMITVCASPQPATCLDNLQDEIDEIIRFSCEQVPVDGTLSAGRMVPRYGRMPCQDPGHDQLDQHDH